MIQMLPVEAHFCGNGVNVAPSHYHNGNVNIDWAAMKSLSYGSIKCVRILIAPESVWQAVGWIEGARKEGFHVIAAYDK